MAIIYVPDELVSKLIAAGFNKNKFTKESIEEKLDRIALKDFKEKLDKFDKDVSEVVP